jgi:hypothetical protein
MGAENEATPGWKQEADDKMKELQSRVPFDVPKDVKGRPLTGKPTRLSKQVAKVNLGFDNTPAWNSDVLMDDIFQDYRVNVANIIDAKARPTFESYLITQVMPTLTKRYSDLMNSCMHHEIDISKNLDIAPMTRIEAEKNREILDKTTESVIKYLRKHGMNNIGELESKWKAARNWLVEVLNVLPSGEGVYGKV